MVEVSTYILKHPVTVEPYYGGDLYLVDGTLWLESEVMQLFTPLDVVELTQKLRKAITESMQRALRPNDIGFSEVAGDIWLTKFNMSRDNAIDLILGVFGVVKEPEQ